MSMVMKTALGAVAGGSLLFAGGMGLANAQPAPDGMDAGKVDVVLGTITTIEGVDVAAAEQIAGLVCSDAVSDAELTAVDRGDTAEVTCTSTQGSQTISFTKNDAGQPGFAPAQHAPTDEVPTDEAPTDEAPTPPTNPAESPEGDDDTVGGIN